jgi:hypothetical protein
LGLRPAADASPITIITDSLNPKNRDPEIQDDMVIEAAAKAPSRTAADIPWGVWGHQPILWQMKFLTEHFLVTFYAGKYTVWTR